MQSLEMIEKFSYFALTEKTLWVLDTFRHLHRCMDFDPWSYLGQNIGVRVTIPILQRLLRYTYSRLEAWGNYCFISFEVA